MQVEAIYIQGRIESVNPIKLKHDHLRLVVLVPDDEIETQSTPYELSPDVLQKQNKCVNGLMRPGAPLCHLTTNCQRSQPSNWNASKPLNFGHRCVRTRATGINHGSIIRY